MFDLGAYLARIGLEGPPDLLEVHRAHATSIPFENLDPHRGVPVSLAIEDLQRKLVRERRGGYCFEHNLLLKAGLEALGAEVDLLLARVRVGAPPGVVRPRSHLVLRVRDEGRTWHADVGFGMGTLIEPIPFGPGHEHEQAGWRFRVVEDGPELVLQTSSDGKWVDLYAFLSIPVPQVDVEIANWWTSTHPGSPFVSGLIVATQTEQGARTVLSDWSGLSVSERTPTASSTTPVALADVPELLEGRFGLYGFLVGEDGRVGRASTG